MEEAVSEKTEIKDEDSEDVLVLVELAGIIDSDFSERIIDKNYKILGIETENPIIQIGHNVFSGEFKDPLGTIAIFQEKPEESTPENKQLELKHLVSKKLRMKRTFINEKSQSSSGVSKN
uniref:Transcription factor TFIIIC triple barrel domain-containing protein n=1 Tax=Strigamia maritima TaxID=126957 RepID=T1JHD0_STRMM